MEHCVLVNNIMFYIIWICCPFYFQTEINFYKTVRICLLLKGKDGVES